MSSREVPLPSRPLKRARERAQAPLRGKTGETPVVMPDPEEYAKLCAAAGNVAVRPNVPSGVKVYDTRSLNKTRINDGTEKLVAEISVEDHPLLDVVQSAIGRAYDRRPVPADIDVPTHYIEPVTTKHSSRLHNFGRFVGRVAEIHWGAPFVTLDAEAATSTKDSLEAMTGDVKRFSDMHPNGLIVVDRFEPASYGVVEPVLLETDFPILRLQAEPND